MRGRVNIFFNNPMSVLISSVGDPGMFLGLLDTDLLITGSDPDPSIIKQK